MGGGTHFFHWRDIDSLTAFLYNKEVAYGALAQLGERIAGSDEVRGSIPLGSTILTTLAVQWGCFLVCGAKRPADPDPSSGIPGALLLPPQKSSLRVKILGELE